MIVLLKDSLKGSNVSPQYKNGFAGTDIAQCPLKKKMNPSYSITLESLRSMVLVAFPAVYRSVA